MKIEWLVASLLFLSGLSALYWFIRHFISTTVKKSIEHQFDIKLETFKQEFTRDLHTIDRKDKFRLASLDKRLAVHQEAYKIALNLFHTLHLNDEKNSNAIRELREFCDNHCLYLTNEARIVLQKAAYVHSTFKIKKSELKDHPNDMKLRSEVVTDFMEISSTAEKIMNAVDTETLSIEPLTPDGKKITAEGIEEEKKEALK